MRMRWKLQREHKPWQVPRGRHWVSEHGTKEPDFNSVERQRVGWELWARNSAYFTVLPGLGVPLGDFTGRGIIDVALTVESQIDVAIYPCYTNQDSLLYLDHKLWTKIKAVYHVSEKKPKQSWSRFSVNRVLPSFGLYHLVDGTVFKINTPFHFMGGFFSFKFLPVIDIDMVKSDQYFQKPLKLTSLFNIYLWNIYHVLQQCYSWRRWCQEVFLPLLLVL